MNTITPIEINAKEVLLLCLETLRDENLSTKFKMIAPYIMQAEHIYEHSAAKNLLDTIEPHYHIGNIVTAHEMSNFYKRNMQAQRAPARKIYDQIRAIPEFGICPLCNHRQVSDPPHFLVPRQADNCCSRNC